MADNPYESSQKQDASAQLHWPIIAALGVATVLFGGYLGGCAIDEFGRLGGAALWGAGALAGFIASKTVVPQKNFGYALAAAVVLAFFVAEACWIHWNIVGAEAWPAAIAKLPEFFSTYTFDAAIGGLFTFFGAQSAYSNAGMRYRYVRVADPS